MVICVPDGELMIERHPTVKYCSLETWHNMELFWKTRQKPKVVVTSS